MPYLGVRTAVLCGLATAPSTQGLVLSRGLEPKPINGQVELLIHQQPKSGPVLELRKMGTTMETVGPKTRTLQIGRSVFMGTQVRELVLGAYDQELNVEGLFVRELPINVDLTA